METIVELFNQINFISQEKSELEKEYVDENTAASALYCISHIVFGNLADVCLFCAANNLLNLYVKQSDANISYYFKSSVFRLTALLECADLDDLFISEEKDDNNNLVSIIQIKNVQFSFHSLKILSERFNVKKKYIKNLEWDGIKKQHCGLSIFKLVLNNSHLLSNKSTTRNNLLDEMNRVEEMVKSKKISIEQLKDVCALPAYCRAKKL